MQFGAFNLESENFGNCGYDYLRITDGDGTVLIGKKCGTSMPPTIRSTSNVVNVLFKTDESGEMSGWSILYKETVQ